MWQVRHNKVGLFMGVHHGMGHYHLVSVCCRGLGVFQFSTPEQIESLFETADSPHLPDSARLKREDFIIEVWDQKAHDLLLDEHCVDMVTTYLQWSLNVWPVGMN
jgi:hypothetical protein